MSIPNEKSEPQDSKIIVEGITENGEPFRPSDWAERMSGSLSTFDNMHRVVYSPLLQPAIRNGEKCMLIDPALKTANPALYESLLDWVKTNNLKICKEE